MRGCVLGATRPKKLMFRHVLPRISLVAKVPIASAALLPAHPRRWGNQEIDGKLGRLRMALGY